MKKALLFICFLTIYSSISFAQYFDQSTIQIRRILSSGFGIRKIEKSYEEKIENMTLRLLTLSTINIENGQSKNLSGSIYEYIEIVPVSSILYGRQLNFYLMKSEIDQVLQVVHFANQNKGKDLNNEYFYKSIDGSEYGFRDSYIFIRFSQSNMSMEQIEIKIVNVNGFIDILQRYK